MTVFLCHKPPRYFDASLNSLKIYICWLFHLSINEMPLLPLVLSIYFWRSTTRTPDKRAIFILLQDLFHVSFLMNLSMNSIPIKNREALYYILFLTHSQKDALKTWKLRCISDKRSKLNRSLNLLKFETLLKFEMLLILPRNLPICKLTVYKKCSSTSNPE